MNDTQPQLCILEHGTWLTAGLKRSFPDWAERIVQRDRADDWLQICRRAEPALTILDFETRPIESATALRMLASNQMPANVIVLISRAQRTVLTGYLPAQCLTVREKPVSIVELSQLCADLLERQTA